MVSQPALTAVSTAAGSQAVPVRLLISVLTSPHTLKSQLASLACCLRPSAHSLFSSRRAGSLLLRAHILHACRMHISYQQAVTSSLFSSRFPKKLMLGGAERFGPSLLRSRLTCYPASHRVRKSGRTGNLHAVIEDLQAAAISHKLQYHSS